MDDTKHSVICKKQHGVTESMSLKTVLLNVLYNTPFISRADILYTIAKLSITLHYYQLLSTTERQNNAVVSFPSRIRECNASKRILELGI